MKYIFFLLLVFLCACNNGDKTNASAKKDLLSGRWKLDSIDLSNKTDTSGLDIVVAYLLDDDHYKHVEFSFNNDRLTEYDETDSTSTSFEWQGDSGIVLKDQDNPEVFLIKKLDNKDLVFRTEDSVVLFFKRTQ